MQTAGKANTIGMGLVATVLFSIFILLLMGIGNVLS